MIIATTRGELFRNDGGPEETDALGDPVDDNSTALGRDFPLSVVERSTREFDEASGAWRTVRYYAGRVPSTIAPKAGDRIRTREGVFYVVSEVESMKRGLAGRSSVTLKMRRTSP